ncbi:YceK/YidQ family lipoprotein [Leptospira mayottensis]|uniref:YceK/YidQ family lipoprotein n=1 Tax=Leptospira mayottensis TaxID=1137606 RepID=UPI000E35E9E8|nr:YceK/YidQ family lipoprotein [Leptospira mayottensis]AXR67727.1 YceK/YidQ family lipoprotein [Leptospira mayottensis]
MIRKIVILSLIVLNLNCATTAVFTEAIQKQKEYFPYEGTVIDLFLISLGPFGKFYGENTTLKFIAGFIDLPFSFALDTILLPGTIPYYIYIKSGRPWSKKWHNQKFNARLKSFRDQNPPYVALRSIIAENDIGTLQEFFKSYDVVALEKKIRYLQEENLLPYEHSEQSSYYPETGIIDYMAAFFLKGEPYNYQRKSNPLRFSDRLEVVYTLYEEFRKDPILEKRYYDTIWKACFSSGVLIENPKVLKKVFQEFSEKKEISDLFASIAQEYSEKRYKQIKDNYSYRDSKTEPQKNSEFWYNRVELLTEIDDLLRKNSELQKEWRRTAWTAAISSGVIAYRPPVLEKAFRELPTETAKSGPQLIDGAHKSQNSQSMNIILKNITNANSFPLDRLEKETIIYILKYPNLLEKLLRVGWDPNRILELEKYKVRKGEKPLEKEETTLLILTMEDESVSNDTLQILLKYGANSSLGVKRKSEGKEYLLYPLAANDNYRNGILKKLKSKTLIEGPLQEFHTKYPIYSVLKSYAEERNVQAFRKTLSGIDLIPMEKEMRRLQKENFVPMEIPRVDWSGSDQTSILGIVSSLAKVYSKYKERQECWAVGKYTEAIEIQKIYYNTIRNDEDLKRFFLENLDKNGAFWEDPIFSEQVQKLLSGDRTDWSRFKLENLVQHTDALDFLMKRDPKMETDLKQRIVAVSLFCGKSKSADVALKYFSGNDYQNFSSDYVNFLLYDSKILELFLKNGMSPNSIGRKEYVTPSGCPLLISVLASPNSWDGLEKLVQLLLKYGANPNLPTEIISRKSQKTVSIYPLNFISDSHHPITNRLLQILKTSGADKNLLTPDSKEIGFGTHVCQWR